MTQTQVRVPWPNWRIVRNLGGGSFGSVYEIQREDIGGFVEKAAMKVIPIPKDPDYAKELLDSGYDLNSINQRYQEDLNQIVDEYRLMAQLKGNANVVYCDDRFAEKKADGIGYVLYIKMELLTPLTKVLTNPVSEAQVIKVGMDLCNALAACKMKNIIHRDIKPANIMMAEDGNYKLGDFGVAKTAERTAGGTYAGTPSFMAPEVYHNQPYRSAVDIYSLGMVLYWMLNERCGPFLPLPPTVPTASQADEANQRRFSGEALPAPAHGSAALRQIVLKACAANPADRYSSPEEMYAALAALQGTAASAHKSPSGTASRTNGTVRDDRSCPSGNGSVHPGDQTMGNSWGNEYDKTQGTWHSQDTGNARGGTVGGTAAGGTSGQRLGPYDIRLTLRITAQEAAQGCTKVVTIPETGKKISVKVPAGSGDGKTLRLSGQGKEDSATGARGTLYLQIKIEQGTADFWKNQDSNVPTVIITADEARNGVSISVKSILPKPMTLQILGGVTDGQTVNITSDGMKTRAKIKVLDEQQSKLAVYKLFPSMKWEEMPASLLDEYRNKKNMNFIAILFLELLLGCCCGLGVVFPPIGFVCLFLMVWYIVKPIKVSSNRKKAQAEWEKRKIL